MSNDIEHDLVEYEVTIAREIAGQWRKVGERLEMHPTAAKYYLAPLGRGLVRAKDKAAAAQAPTNAPQKTAPKLSKKQD